MDRGLEIGGRNALALGLYTGHGETNARTYKSELIMRVFRQLYIKLKFRYVTLYVQVIREKVIIAT